MLVPIPAIPFPDVPVAPGVPPVARGPSNDNTIPPPKASADGPGLPQTQTTPQWGIFNSGGQPALDADSVLAFDYRSEYRISDFPVEGGEFQSYNKVQVPFDVKFTYTKGGSDGDRTAFLNAAQDLVKSLDLYTAVTPEITYRNVNVTHVDYARTQERGVTLLTVDVWAQQVRTSAAAQFTSSTPLLVNTQQPSGASPQNDGSVQPRAPTPAEITAASDANRAIAAGPPDGG